MIFFPSRLRFLAILPFPLIGCQYDPHGDLYLTAEPRDEDIVGDYILDRYDLPREVPIAYNDVEVEIRADGTFIAKNIPPWKLEGPDRRFFSMLLSGTGKWEKATLGTLDPGNHRIWGIYLRTPDDRFSPADFTGAKPPYGLIFVLGDPDSGNAVLLKRKL